PREISAVWSGTSNAATGVVATRWSAGVSGYLEIWRGDRDADEVPFSASRCGAGHPADPRGRESGLGARARLSAGHVGWPLCVLGDRIRDPAGSGRDPQ